MKTKSYLLIIPILVLALANMACGITFNLPVVTQIKTGPLVSEDIKVDLPANTDRIIDVNLSFGAGVLNLSPGATDALLEGTASYNVPDIKPVIIEKMTSNGLNSVRIEQGNLNVRGFPRFDERLRNEWDFQFGTAAMDLKVNAGAYTGEYELGGLALAGLEISDGASDVRLTFSEPNPIEMNTFRYNTGASEVKLNGLANANFESMVFRCGAGNYVLDFSGELKRDASIQIDAGISNVKIILPKDANAKLVFEGGLSNVSSTGGWRSSGSSYNHDGSGPTLSFEVKMGAGNLELNSR
jgi:hypothetical protein